MVDLKITPSGSLRFTLDPVMQGKLFERYSEAASVLEKIKRASSEFKLPSEDLLILGSHPLAQGLLAFQRGHISQEKAETIACELSLISDYSMELLKRDEQSILQLQCLLGESETRGEPILMMERCSHDQTTLGNSLRTIKDSCGPGYRRFVSIVKTISFVEVPQMGRVPYFSGSDTNYWGSIHTADPNDDYILAETLTHEAAHHWMFLLELVTPVSGMMWESNSWISPWRSDARPIGGIIHGVFAFSCAVIVLNYLRENLPPSHDNTRDRMMTRICRLIAQVEAGGEEIGRCPHLTDEGRLVVSRSLERMCHLYKKIHPPKIEEARTRCREEQASKRKQLETAKA